MSIFHVINLAGGIALFLYGMSIMGSGLEKIAGGRMQGVLQKLTSSTLRGVLLGTLITAVIQSSAGTIVIVVGLVNSGILALPQAVGVIMGANIGTTVTGQLIRLADISGDSLLLTLVQPSTFSPIVAFVGAIFYVFFKSPKRRNVGQIMLGFGILFTGMFMMEDAVRPLRESEMFVSLFTRLQNPILGLLAGLVVTVAIQSSSASVGILQALSTTGAVHFSNAVPIIMGTHVGTAFTPLLAAMGASKNAKRAAVIHLYFNLIGSAAFLVILYLAQGLVGLPIWDAVLGKGSIANIHTLSSILATIAFLPFTGLLVRLAELTVPDEAGEVQELALPVLDERLFTSPAVAIQQAKSAVEEMAARAAHNYRNAVQMTLSYDDEVAARINQREDLIDRAEVLVGDYLIRISNQNLSESESRAVSELLNFITEFERIGDYAINITERGAELRDKELAFSETAQGELQVLSNAISEILTLTADAFRDSDMAPAERVEPLEETIDQICEDLRERHIDRLKTGSCQVETGIIFLDVLTNMERISDHCSNVATRIIGSESDAALDSHQLRRALHDGAMPNYNELLEQYMGKYYAGLKQ